MIASYLILPRATTEVEIKEVFQSHLGRITWHFVFSAPVSTPSKACLLAHLCSRSPLVECTFITGSSCHELGSCARLPARLIHSKKSAGGDLRPHTLKEMLHGFFSELSLVSDDNDDDDSSLSAPTFGGTGSNTLYFAEKCAMLSAW